MNIETTNAPKLHCPYCHGHRLQVATSTQSSTYTNVTRKQVTTTVLGENTRYWCCSDCGGIFPFPQDLKQQADDMLKQAENTKPQSIVRGVVGGIFLLMASIPLLSGLMTGLAVLALVASFALYFFVGPFYKKQAAQLQQEYEDLLSKCME